MWLYCLSLCSLGVINLHLSSSVADASTYAHYLFNAFDTGHTGSIKFEVCFALAFALLVSA